MNHEVSLLVDDAAIGILPPSYRLPASVRIGRVRIAVSELARSLDFYTRVIGLQVLERETSLARLGAHSSQVVLLELEELPNVEPIGRRSRLGLYHTAFLLPSRAALSSFVQHLNGLHVHFGSGDHLYSEAMYLTDPDGLSVEVYADRPRSEWTIDNREIVSATEPVRFDLLPAVPEDSWQGMPAGTTMGHVHFYVGDLERAASFYGAECMSNKLTTKQSEFSEVLGIIRTGPAKAYEAVNVALIETYWAVGAHLSRKVAEASSGKGVVKELSTWLLTQAPELKSFSASNLWRMKQFYEMYADSPKLATPLRVLSWTKHQLLVGCKTAEEREFYLIAATRGHWSHRELARQIQSSAFERTMLSDLKLATPSRVLL